MVYKKNFIAVVKSQGKILREVSENTIHIPFGSEYSILLKNLDARRALVSISIDGKSIGNSLIIEANSNFELERFIENNNYGNRFRFIQKTKEISDHRGDRVDDGIIRVEYSFEKPAPIVRVEDHWHYNHWNYPSWTYTYTSHDPNNYNVRGLNNIGSATGGSVGGGSCSSSTNKNENSSVNACYCSFGADALRSAKRSDIPTPGIPMDDEGITVKGSQSNQSFQYGTIGALEQTEVITLKLNGYVGSGPAKISKPVTVKDKKICPTCGKFNKYQNRYCSGCGTFLE